MWYKFYYLSYYLLPRSVGMLPQREKNGAKNKLTPKKGCEEPKTTDPQQKIDTPYEYD